MYVVWCVSSRSATPPTHPCCNPVCTVPPHAPRRIARPPGRSMSQRACSRAAAWGRGGAWHGSPAAALLADRTRAAAACDTHAPAHRADVDGGASRVEGHVSRIGGPGGGDIGDGCGRRRGCRHGLGRDGGGGDERKGQQFQRPSAVRDGLPHRVGSVPREGGAWGQPWGRGTGPKAEFALADAGLGSPRLGAQGDGCVGISGWGGQLAQNPALESVATRPRLACSAHIRRWPIAASLVCRAAPGPNWLLTRGPPPPSNPTASPPGHPSATP